MKNEKISVIVPIYNVEKYICKCIESIINQTYKNIEIILVDDGSPDNCGNICDDYALKDKRIKVFHKKNGGLSDARNYGIKKATGKYISLIDSDDYIQPDMLEYLYNLITKYDSDISICGAMEFYENDEISIKNPEKDVKVFDNVSAIKELLLDRNIRSHAWDKLYKKSLFKNIQYPVGKKMEDIATTYKLFNISNKIVVGNQIKYMYLQRNNGIMLSKKLDMWIDFYELSMERYLEICNLYHEMIENKISILQTIIYLYCMADNSFKEYLESKNIKKEYRKIYSENIIDGNVFKFARIKLLLFKVSPNFYRWLWKFYLFLKRR